MALTCPVDLDVEGLRSEVQTMYSRVAAALRRDGTREAATRGNVVLCGRR
jgi:hypothetical protein